jgi:alpha-L-rhamnosidase
MKRDLSRRRRIMLQLIDLRTEYIKNPLGLDVDKPRFSWILQSEANNTVQSSYRLITQLSHHRSGDEP